MKTRHAISTLTLTIFCFGALSCTWFNKVSKPKKENSGLSNSHLFENKSFREEKNSFRSTSYTRDSDTKLIVQKSKSLKNKAMVLKDNRCYHEPNLWNRNQNTPNDYRTLYDIKGTFSQSSSTVKEFAVNDEYKDSIRYSYNRLTWQKKMSNAQAEFDAPARMLPEFALLKFFMNQAKQSGNRFKVKTKSMTKKYNDQYSRVIETKKRLRIGSWRCRDHVRLYLEHSDYVSPAEKVRNENGLDPRIIALSKGDYSMLQYTNYDQEYVLDIKYNQENNITYEGSYLERHIRCYNEIPMFAKNLPLDELAITCQGNRLLFTTIQAITDE